MKNVLLTTRLRPSIYFFLTGNKAKGNSEITIELFG